MENMTTCSSINRWLWALRPALLLDIELLGPNVSSHILIPFLFHFL